MTIHRPDFASVTLANDLRKLEEDWLRLESTALSKSAAEFGTHLHRSHIFAYARVECTLARTHLIEGVITWDIARLKRDMLEASFDVARRDINGLAPIPYTLAEEVPC
jgi:hypothetical protein